MPKRQGLVLMLNAQATLIMRQKRGVARRWSSKSKKETKTEIKNTVNVMLISKRSAKAIPNNAEWDKVSPK